MTSASPPVPLVASRYLAPAHSTGDDMAGKKCASGMKSKGKAKGKKKPKAKKKAY